MLKMLDNMLKCQQEDCPGVVKMHSATEESEHCLFARFFCSRGHMFALEILIPEKLGTQINVFPWDKRRPYGRLA